MLFAFSRNKRRILAAVAAGAAGSAVAYYIYRKWSLATDDEPCTSGSAEGGTLIEPNGSASTAQMVSNRQGSRTASHLNLFTISASPSQSTPASTVLCFASHLAPWRPNFPLSSTLYHSVYRLPLTASQPLSKLASVELSLCASLPFVPTLPAPVQTSPPVLCTHQQKAVVEQSSLHTDCNHPGAER